MELDIWEASVELEEKAPQGFFPKGSPRWTSKIGIPVTILAHSTGADTTDEAGAKGPTLDYTTCTR